VFGPSASMMQFNPELSAARWVAVFDLLGTRALMAAGREWRVLDSYSRAEERIRWRADGSDALTHVWFSDTFMLAARDDSLESFVSLDSAARGFIAELTINHLPVRGAIAYGRAYVDQANGIIIGPAYLEAFEYADNQDWIGLILCPSAVARTSSFASRCISPLYYADHIIPWSRGRTPDSAPERLPACIIGGSMSAGGRNSLRDGLAEMAAGVIKETVRLKYQRSIAFIDEYGPLR
jgi:hypothetical protein